MWLIIYVEFVYFFDIFAYRHSGRKQCHKNSQVKQKAYKKDISFVRNKLL